MADPDSTIAASWSNLSWRRSRHSGALGNCVELAPVTGSRIAVRDSRQPAGPFLVYPRTGLVTFVNWVRAGRPD
jgi:uncharacterized protein DUF397